jgi:hypothetical protein
VTVLGRVERDLEAGQEEQEDDADLREDLQRRRDVDQIEHHRPDQDPGGQLADDRRDLRDRQQVDEQRRRGGRRDGDDEIRVVEGGDAESQATIGLGWNASGMTSRVRTTSTSRSRARRRTSSS